MIELSGDSLKIVEADILEDKYLKHLALNVGDRALSRGVGRWIVSRHKLLPKMMIVAANGWLICVDAIFHPSKSNNDGKLGNTL